MKQVMPSDLPNTPERAICRLAMIAALDVFHGGARALVLLKRLKRSPHYMKFEAAVADSYSTDYSVNYTFWECPECGEPCFGIHNAIGHCLDEEI